MLKLVKILNSHTNDTETERLSIDEGTDVSFGCAMKLVNGRLTHAEPTDTPEYIAFAAKSERGTLTVIPVTNAMIFESPLHIADGEVCRLGDPVGLYINEGKATGVCPDSLGKGKIVEISDTPHTVYVKFTK